MTSPPGTRNALPLPLWKRKPAPKKRAPSCSASWKPSPPALSLLKCSSACRGTNPFSNLQQCLKAVAREIADTFQGYVRWRKGGQNLGIQSVMSLARENCRDHFPPDVFRRGENAQFVI